MKIEFTGRNTRITPALGSHVEEKLTHTARALDDVVDAHVILAVEKYRHMAEILVRKRRGSLSGKAESEDMYVSIQRAIDRIEKQVRRSREKTVSRRRRGSADKSIAAGRDKVAAEPLAPVESEPLPPMVIDEAPDRVKPIGVEEAVLLLEKSARPFVVFRNQSSGRIATLYRRAGGDFGLVEFKS